MSQYFILKVFEFIIHLTSGMKSIKNKAIYIYFLKVITFFLMEWLVPFNASDSVEFHIQVCILYTDNCIHFFMKLLELNSNRRRCSWIQPLPHIDSSRRSPFPGRTSQHFPKKFCLNRFQPIKTQTSLF